MPTSIEVHECSSNNCTNTVTYPLDGSYYCSNCYSYMVYMVGL